MTKWHYYKSVMKNSQTGKLVLNGYKHKREKLSESFRLLIKLENDDLSKYYTLLNDYNNNYLTRNKILYLKQLEIKLYLDKKIKKLKINK